MIAKDSDKDDPLDAERLAALFRGGYLKAVHQSQTLERSLLKQHVSFYHDRVRERVRQGNQLMALLRRHGVFVSSSDLSSPEDRESLVERLPKSSLLRNDVRRLFSAYEFLRIQEGEIHCELIEQARQYEVVRRFTQVPGLGWIRAVTFFVYIDTPHRFQGKSSLWRYSGIGLERRRSGSGPTRVQLVSRGHRRLKNILIGAAKTAIASINNPFATSMFTGGRKKVCLHRQRVAMSREVLPRRSGVSGNPVVNMILNRSVETVRWPKTRRAPLSTRPGD